MAFHHTNDSFDTFLDGLRARLISDTLPTLNLPIKRVVAFSLM